MGALLKAISSFVLALFSLNFKHTEDPIGDQVKSIVDGTLYKLWRIARIAIIGTGSLVVFSFGVITVGNYLMEISVANGWFLNFDPAIVIGGLFTLGGIIGIGFCLSEKRWTQLSTPPLTVSAASPRTSEPSEKKETTPLEQALILLIHDFVKERSVQREQEKFSKAQNETQRAATTSQSETIPDSWSPKNSATSTTPEPKATH